jgi:hypothetical protein
MFCDDAPVLADDDPIGVGMDLDWPTDRAGVHVALLLNSGPGVLANFGPPPVPQPTVTLMDQGALCGLESQSGFVRAAPS